MAEQKEVAIIQYTIETVLDRVKAIIEDEISSYQTAIDESPEKGFTAQIERNTWYAAKGALEYLKERLKL